MLSLSGKTPVSVGEGTFETVSIWSFAFKSLPNKIDLIKRFFNRKGNFRGMIEIAIGFINGGFVQRQDRILIKFRR